MNNFKVKEIIKFSFNKSIQNKWFVIFNLLAMISIVLMLNWGNISNLFETKEDNEIKVAILDESDLIYESVYEQLSEKFEIEKIYSNDYTGENIPDNLVIIEVLEDSENLFDVSIISKEGILSQKYYEIEDSLYSARNILFEDIYGISAEDLTKFQSELEINRIMLSVNAQDSDTKELMKLFSSAITYLVAILIFSKIANEISQEKQSKSSEYILTAVSAKEYLFAKIFGNVAVLIFQGLLMIIYYYIAMIISNISNMSNLEMGSIASIMQVPITMDILNYVFVLLVYNILNIILLCIIQATLSAKTSSSSEAGNTVSFLAFVMVAAYIATVQFITPYSKVNMLFEIISCLPILSAYFIPALMIIGQINLWQIVLSLVLIVIAIPVTFNICSKIFKNGILDYTKVNKKVAKKLNESKDMFVTKRQMKSIGFVMGASIIIYFGVQTIFSIIGAFVLPTMLKNIFIAEDISMILQILLQLTSLGIASIFVFSYCEKKQESEKNLRNKSTTSEKIKIIFITIFLVFALQVILSMLVYPALDLDYNITDSFTTDANSSFISKIILVITIAIMPAIFEELFFRKAMIDFLSQYGEKFAWLFSSLLFGMIHMNLSQGLFAFLIGLIFGGIYLYTKDIKLTMLIHFINNGFGALAMILSGISMLIAIGILGICFIIGMILAIISIIKKETRTQIKETLTYKISKTKLINYKYIFTDFSFDVSMILIFLMGILTENILR